MSAWFEPTVLLFEGEDEAALKAEFVRLCAKHGTADPMAIGQYVFRGLRDPGTRGSQAGQIWFQQLEVKEAIAVAKRQGEISALPSKEQLIAETIALARNEGVSDKDRVAAYKLAMEASGFIVKATEDKTANKRQLPAIIFAQYPDE